MSKAMVAVWSDMDWACIATYRCLIAQKTTENFKKLPGRFNNLGFLLARPGRDDFRQEAKHTRANAEGFKAERPAIRTYPKADLQWSHELGLVGAETSYDLYEVPWWDWISAIISIRTRGRRYAIRQLQEAEEAAAPT